MSNWGTSDSGILRKNRVKENPDDLLVFGYSCKIFRDDEKALYIDKGKHLIPWMGDAALKIDRYDGRGTLSDLKQFEAGREGYDTLRWLGLSESEKKLEELCDKERYYSLEINEEEEEMYKEEAAKRQKTNAFAFDYNTRSEESELPTEGIPTVPEKEEEDEPYKASPILDVPVNINIPKTVKEYARIEKTALFVCRQGLQMEILIKAKQADNPQFSFLTVQDPLYKFYRHVLSAFKNGRYQPQCDNKKSDEDKPATVSQTEDQDSHYLHPSLLSANTKPDSPPQQNPPIPSVPYRPSADCAYSQLVNRIQGTGLGANSQSETVAAQQQQPSQMQVINQMSLEQQYHQFYYVQQFYEYWRHSVINSEQGAIYASLPLDFSQLDTNMQTYIHQLAWAQFVQHHQQKQLQEAQESQKMANDNSYAQIVSNLNKDGVNPYTANMPQLPLVVSEERKVVVEEPKKEEKTVILVKNDDIIEVKKPLLSLAAAYGSGSDTDSDSSDSEMDSKASFGKQLEDKKEVYRVPSGKMQNVIDKMAEYVAKNGENFEEIIKQKGDKRFDFLIASHVFNKYYKNKLRELKEPEKVEVKKVDAIKPTKPKLKKVVTPVSFSIKKPKEETPKEIKSALPMEDSSDEESNPNDIPKSPSNSDNKKVGTVANILQIKVENTTNNIASELPPQNEGLPITTKSEDKPLIISRIEHPKKRSRSPSKSPKPLKSGSKTPTNKYEVHVEEVREKKKKTDTVDMFDVGDTEKKEFQNGVLETDDPILEMIELEMDERTDDRASDAKEKARQLERKRKAAMFLKLKSVQSKPVKPEKISRRSPSVRSRRTSIDSNASHRSRSRTREKSKIQEKLTSRHHRSRSKEESRSQRSRSRGRTRKHKKNKDKDRNRSRSRNRDNEDRRRREKKKKSDKKKHSKSKKKSRRPRSLSKHRSYSKSRSRSKSRSSSLKSHISIQDSS